MSHGMRLIDLCVVTHRPKVHQSFSMRPIISQPRPIIADQKGNLKEGFRSETIRAFPLGKSPFMSDRAEGSIIREDIREDQRIQHHHKGNGAYYSQPMLCEMLFPKCQCIASYMQSNFQCATNVINISSSNTNHIIN